MKDERDEQLDNLFRTARTIKPDTAVVEEHFETRLMASIEERRNSHDVMVLLDMAAGSGFFGTGHYPGDWQYFYGLRHVKRFVFVVCQWR